MRFAFMILVGVITIFFVPARSAGQTGKPPVAQDLAVVEDQAWRALRAGNFSRGAAMFERLAAAHPDVVEYRIELGHCLVESGKPMDALAVYEALLAGEPENIVALAALARLEARRAAAEPNPGKQADLLDRAKDALKRGARHGLNAIRAIRVYPELQALRGDVGFEVELIRAPQQLLVDTTGMRDPFDCPLVRVDGRGGPTPPTGTSGSDALTRAEQEAIVARLAELLEGIDRAVTAGDPEALWKLWSEAEEHVKKQPLVTNLDLEVRFRELVARQHAARPLAKSLLLGAFYREGAQLVGTMRSELAAERFQAVVEASERLEAHGRRMVQCSPDFSTTAQLLVAEGKPLADRARVALEAAVFPLRVTATVVGGGASRAIVNDHDAGEGDLVRTVKGEPIAGLRIVEIRKRRVVFGWKDLQFGRPLEPIGR